MTGSLLHDFRFAARMLRRSPLFTITAALTLGIGLGANATIYTVVNTLLFRTPAGVAAPDRLVDITGSGRQGFVQNTSYPVYEDVRSRARSLAGVYAIRNAPQPMSLRSGDSAERVFGMLVTSNYFDVLGTRPYRGQFFPGEGREPAGQNPSVVLAHRFWQRRLAADPAVVGRSLTLNGQLFTVAGIAPEHFVGTTLLAPDLWVPMSMADVFMDPTARFLDNRNAVWLTIGGRLTPGVSIAQAQAELDAIARAIDREHPIENHGRGLHVAASAPLPGNAAPVRAFLSLLLAVVVLVLAITCFNIAGVLLARAVARRRELAVRVALGAARGAIVRQLLVETLLLFAGGAAVALLLSRAMSAALLRLLPVLPVPLDLTLEPDARVLLVMAAVTVGTALLSGVVPALHASRADVVRTIADEGHGPARLRVRHALVVAQVALSLLLAVGAVLFGRALTRAASVDPGFDPRNVEVTSLDLSLAHHTGATGPALVAQLLDAVRALPGVESASSAAVIPVHLDQMGLGMLTAAGRPSGADAPLADANWNVIEPGYFATMRIPLVAGRDFTAADRAGARDVVILNQTAARELWPGEDPVGKEVVQQLGAPGRPGSGQRSLFVVGLARDAKYRVLGEPPAPAVYVPLAQQYVPHVSLLTRTTGKSAAADVRRLLSKIAPALPPVDQTTMEESMAVSLLPQRIAAAVAGSLGMVGLLIAAIGIYGVTAYVVTRRTREIGVRMALGADRGDVVRLVLGQGMRMAASGAAIGLALAAALTWLARSLLFGVPPLDPVSFGGTTVLFAAIALAACYVPVRRAIAIEAVDALRCE